MNRVVWFCLCALVGLELVGLGLLVPVHLQAIDATWLRLAGANGPSLVAEGTTLAAQDKTGPARLLLLAADQKSLPGREKLAATLAAAEKAHPTWKLWGGQALYLDTVLDRAMSATNLQSTPVVDVLVPEATRRELMEAMDRSQRPGVVEILKTRDLTNSVVFPPVRSPSGQPLDATIAMTALLFQQDHFPSGLRNSIQMLVAAANRGTNLQPLEPIYLDLLSLGKRLNWGQLVHLLKRVPDTNALENVATLIREQEAHLPVVYSAMHCVDNARTVAAYLEHFPATGLRDLAFAVGTGVEPARAVLTRQQPIHYPTVRDRLTGYGAVAMIYEPTARLAADYPGLGVGLKYTLYVLGTLLIARALLYLSPSLMDELTAERPLVSGPQLAIGLCLLFIMLFFTESLVTRATPAVGPPLRIKFPMASAALRAKIPHQTRAMIDKVSAVSLLTFFVMQATIYVFCRMKLAEIRRQTLPSKLKLRLLENEEHLFDAGLYFGFVGTVVSLILVSVGIVKPSLMAAYSSTSFGIIFVSILKIFHLRPFRRRLILDAEISDRQAQVA
ncbi:MAG: hypothetical protein U1G07_24300 [Verrucomicrobiota bacterium]